MVTEGTDIMKSFGYSGGSVQFSEFVFKGIWEFGPLLNKPKPGITGAMFRVMDRYKTNSKR